MFHEVEAQRHTTVPDVKVQVKYDHDDHNGGDDISLL
jgi:hypothetical protein